MSMAPELLPPEPPLICLISSKFWTLSRTLLLRRFTRSDTYKKVTRIKFKLTLFYLLFVLPLAIFVFLYLVLEILQNTHCPKKSNKINYLLVSRRFTTGDWSCHPHVRHKLWLPVYYIDPLIHPILLTRQILNSTLHSVKTSVQVIQREKGFEIKGKTFHFEPYLILHFKFLVHRKN